MTTNPTALGEAIQALLKKEGRVTDKRYRGRGSFKPTQKALALACEIRDDDFNKKLRGHLPLTDYEMRAIFSTLIWWGLITRRSQLFQFFDLAGYTLADEYWQEEPWRSLPDDTKPPDNTVVLLPLENSSFEDWDRDRLLMWLYNDKTGKIKPVKGVKGGKAVEVSGHRGNREWVYCRTRETQELPVMPGSRIGLTFWAKKTQEGKDPERAKYVEIFYYDGFQWQWGFSQEVTYDGGWRQYTTEWWKVPTDAQKVSVGVVVFRDGAFQVDDIELRVRMDK